jgi:hypothetical protein
MMALRHILAVLWEMLSVTPIMADGQVEEVPLHALHAHQIWILWIFDSGDTKKSICIQLLLTTKRRFNISVWIPIRLSATAAERLNGCDGPWDASRRALNLMENILSTCYKYTLSAIAHKLKVSGHVMDIFLVLVRGICAKTFSAPFSYTLYIH